MDFLRGPYSSPPAISSGDRHGFSLSLQTVDIQGAPAGFTVHIVSVEADWDDESERVEVRVEVLLSSVLLSSDMIGVNISQLRYWVTILAKI
jgi:hypothetical protein